MPEIIALEDIPPLVGQALKPSDWFEITQKRVNQFADATNDHQFIHVKPLKAKFTPFGGTIAHGFLTLSLLTYLQSTIPMGGGQAYQGLTMGVNYGLEKVRFPSPVKVDSKVRARRVLQRESSL